MAIAPINIAQMGSLPKPNRAMMFILQGGRDLKDYVEEFISTSHLAICDNIMLMEGSAITRHEHYA